MEGFINFLVKELGQLPRILLIGLSPIIVIMYLIIGYATKMWIVVAIAILSGIVLMALIIIWAGFCIYQGWIVLT